MVQDNEGKRVKLQEESSVLSTALVKSKSCINKSSDKVQYRDKTDLDVGSPLLSSHLQSVQQEFNKWISLHISE